MTTISAKTILRSRNVAAHDKVLSTLLLRYPRFIHAEFMTHRVLSRNAASSRAIPVSKIIDSIMEDTAMPLHWGKNQKGMQASEECNTMLALIEDGLGAVKLTRQQGWMEARDQAIRIAEAFDRAGYHKQVVNRLLEPFMHITVLVSATEWDNFLALRDHADAEPHIQILAQEIRKCLDNDPVQWLDAGDWHLPFVDDHDWAGINSIETAPAARLAIAQSLSVARCASTSYKTVDGFDMTPDRATEIYRKLINSRPMHASPLEHVAAADHLGHGGWRWPECHGNFVGFRQLRHEIQVQ
jgi:hypothetical protein